MKICNKCKLEKPLIEFNKDSHKPDGYCYSCRSCFNESLNLAREKRKLREFAPPDFKTCHCCQTTKPCTDFHRDMGRVDFLQVKCKECQLEKNIKYNKINKEALNQIKAEKGCIRCGMKDPRCLDFHHKNPEEKSFTIGASGARRPDKMLAEAEKCEVICANCHRIEHAERIGTPDCVFSQLLERRQPKK